MRLIFYMCDLVLFFIRWNWANLICKRTGQTEDLYVVIFV